MMAVCPVCQSDQSRDVLSIRQVPVLCNYFWPSKNEALRSPCGDIALSFCPTCGHLYNRAFDPERVVYQPGYENSLFGSPRFRVYIHRQARRLVHRYNLQGKRIVEIGSGEGEFLRLICSLGGNQGVGYDPARPAGEEDAGAWNIRWVPAPYRPEPSAMPPDLVCCRHVLEHVADPVEFLQVVRQAKASVFFEVPNALYTLRESGIWDIIYEHPSYFTPSSLGRLFATAGFTPLEISEVYGRQYLTILAEPDEPKRQTHSLEEVTNITLEEIVSLVDGFAKKFTDLVQKWKNRLRDCSREGMKVVLWGSGSKGVTFLNLVAQEGLIQYVVDVNPRKQGRFVPRSAQEVVPPDFLKTYQPDLVLVMNPLYQQEIQEMLSRLQVAARVEVATG